MNVDYLRGLLKTYMYRDRATIRRAVKTQIGKTDDFSETYEVIYSDVPGHLAQYGKQLYAHRDDRAQKLTADLRWSCHPDVDIRPNDVLTIDHCGQIFELIAGEAFNYPTHKEISVRRRKEAGQS